MFCNWWFFIGNIYLLRADNKERDRNDSPRVLFLDGDFDTFQRERGNVISTNLLSELRNLISFGAFIIQENNIARCSRSYQKVIVTIARAKLKRTKMKHNRQTVFWFFFQMQDDLLLCICAMKTTLCSWSDKGNPIIALYCKPLHNFWFMLVVRGLLSRSSLKETHFLLSIRLFVL